MRQGVLLGFAALVVGFGITSAAEAAMCGRSCNSGGRYFPGPPSVCADNGLNYCGSSRGRGGGGAVVAPGVVIGPGGVGVRRRQSAAELPHHDGAPAGRHDDHAPRVLE